MTKHLVPVDMDDLDLVLKLAADTPAGPPELAAIARLTERLNEARAVVAAADTGPAIRACPRCSGTEWTPCRHVEEPPGWHCANCLLYVDADGKVPR